MLRMGNAVIQCFRTLYDVIHTLDDLKMEAENEKINDLTEVDIISVITAISLVLHILSLIARVVL